jgi:hypothetical protein
VGRQARLVSNLSAPSYGDPDVLAVYTWKQTGPEKWSRNLQVSLPFGEEVEITGIINSAGRYPDPKTVIEVRAQDGKQYVIGGDNIVAFDFYECDMSVLLETVDRPGTGYVRYLPAMPSPEARPLDRDGNWIKEGDLKSAPFVVCSKYQAKNPNLGMKPSVECLPVYAKNRWGNWYYLDTAQLRLLRPRERPDFYFNR